MQGVKHPANAAGLHPANTLKSEGRAILFANRVILAYKNFAASRNVSHIGLGVAAMNTAKVLRKQGVSAEVKAIGSAGELRQWLDGSVSHLVVSTPWIPT